MQHGIEQYIKIVEHEKKCAAWKDYYTKKVQHRNGAVWEKCNMKRVQHKKSETWKTINCLSEIRKKCTRLVHYSAQMDDELSVDGPLYTGCVKTQTASISKL